MPVTQHKWWHAYGPFDPGENNHPHLGQVIRYYRELRKWKVSELAAAMQQSPRHIYEIESSPNMPELISRRQALCDILKIPPVLLGLSSMRSTDDGTFDIATGTLKVIDARTMHVYEGILALSWELYYTSSAQRAASNIDHWLQFLAEAANEASGIQRDQLISTLCRFYQLSGVAARDRMDIARALQDGKKAIELAFQLENSELIAASLFRHGKTYLKQQQYDLGIKELEAALPYAERSRDPLKGYVYQAAAEAYSIVADQDVQTQKRSLTMLDQVGRIVRKGNLEDDGSFVKLNIAGLYMDRASALTRFHRLGETQNALNIARENLGPELTRWQARLLIAEAEAYFAEGDPDSCCELAFEALKVIHATQSRSNEALVSGLHRRLSLQYRHHPLVTRLGVQLSNANTIR
jgi:transcriptional regulator with XRE-family HTH domain